MPAGLYSVTIDKNFKSCIPDITSQLSTFALKSHTCLETSNSNPWEHLNSNTSLSTNQRKSIDLQRQTNECTIVNDDIQNYPSRDNTWHIRRATKRCASMHWDSDKTCYRRCTACLPVSLSPVMCSLKYTEIQSNPNVLPKIYLRSVSSAGLNMLSRYIAYADATRAAYCSKFATKQLVRTLQNARKTFTAPLEWITLGGEISRCLPWYFHRVAKTEVKLL